MKKEELSEDREEKQQVSNWPFFWGFLLYTAGNVDYVVIPLILQPLGLSFWKIFLIATPLANLEIVAGYRFWSWFTWKWLPTTEPVKDTVELTKDIITLLREEGLLGTIIYKIRENFKWATTSNKFSRFINTGGHFGMFCLGAESFVSGGRLIGTVLCASTKRKNGLYSLIVGNTIHVAISIWTWNWLFYFWDEYRGWLMTVAIMAVLFIVGRYFWRKIKRGVAEQ